MECRPLPAWVRANLVVGALLTIGSIASIAAERSVQDGRSQREYAWQVVAQLGVIDDQRQALSSAWHRSEEVFSASGAVTPGSEPSASSSSKAAVHGGGMQSGEPQIIIVTLYNEAAYRHVRNHRLYERAQLEQLRTSGAEDPTIPANRTIPAFPKEAVIVLSAWWPIARNRVTLMPVWDPERNPPHVRGNNYATWRRAVAVDNRSVKNDVSRVGGPFAGRAVQDVRQVGLDAFHHILVDEAMEQQIRNDELARKAALIALGRELRVGDALALVAVHVATRARHQDWDWTTLWWHDDAERGAFAADRPTELSPLWRNYLLDVAVDAEMPLSSDGAPQAVFNPWLEARFPDAGAGGGVASNCITCHRRASYPPVSFLPVTQGAPDLRKDPAYASGRLRTDLIWSVARQAK